MKLLTSSIIVALFAGIIFISCEKDEETVTPTPSETNVNSTVNVTTETQQSVSKLIESFNKTYLIVKEDLTKFTPVQTDSIFVDKVISSGLTGKIHIKEEIIPGINSIDYLVLVQNIGTTNSFITQQEYKTHLTKLNTEAQSSSLTTEEKQDFAGKIYFMIEFVDWMETLANQQSRPVYSVARLKTTDPEPNQCGSWWKCWGKCAAGTIGGGITGALSAGIGGAGVGAGIGVAFGSVTVPVIGSVPGAAIGGAIGGVASGVIGGVGGALVGTATSCD